MSSWIVNMFNLHCVCLYSHCLQKVQHCLAISIFSRCLQKHYHVFFLPGVCRALLGVVGTFGLWGKGKFVL